MKILLLTPYFKQNRGNSTTAKRIFSGLEQKGLDVTVFAYDEDRWNDEIQREADSCDVIHIIHFYRFSKWAKKTNFQLNKPFILTNGGTDVNLHLFNQRDKFEMEHILQRARAITVFTNDAKEKICSAYSNMNSKVKVVKQSVWLPSLMGIDSADIIKAGNPVFLLPSGLREVKDVFFLMEEMILLKKKYPNLQFLIAGMVLDENIYETLQQYLSQYKWIHFFENVPFEKMILLYRCAHVVLNTSISEGQSSALLEAMDMGCIILARDNPGNASIIQDGINGYLFKDGNEFLKKVEGVLNDKDRTEKIIQNAKSYIEAQHRFEDEIDKFIKLYEDCVQ